MCIRYHVDEARYETWRNDRGWETVSEEVAAAILEKRHGRFPGDSGPIIVNSGSSLEERAARWGMTPAWAEKASFGKVNAYNARSETVTEKPTFRTAFAKRRCLIPMSSFYERADGRWLKIQPVERSIVCAAGLYEPPNRHFDVPTFSMVTTVPNCLIEQAHDRMPVILAEDDYGAWLDPAAPKEDLLALLTPCPEEWLTMEDAGPVTTGARKGVEATAAKPKDTLDL